MYPFERTPKKPCTDDQRISCEHRLTNIEAGIKGNNRLISVLIAVMLALISIMGAKGVL